MDIQGMYKYLDKCTHLDNFTYLDSYKDILLHGEIEESYNYKQNTYYNEYVTIVTHCI